MLPERPMKIEVVVDPSRLAPTPTLASRVAPAENTSPVTNGNGTQAARSVPVPLGFRIGSLIDTAVLLAGIVVAPLVAGAREWALARPSGHRRQRKISMLRWRLVTSLVELVDPCSMYFSPGLYSK